MWLIITGGVVNVDGAPVTYPNITMLIELHGKSLYASCNIMRIIKNILM